MPGIGTSTISANSSANRQAEIKHKLSAFRLSNLNMILLYAIGSQSNNAGGGKGRTNQRCRIMAYVHVQFISLFQRTKQPS
jgi:hypothetical protein